MDGASETIRFTGWAKPLNCMIVDAKSKISEKSRVIFINAKNNGEKR